jgi:putative transposase
MVSHPAEYPLPSYCGNALDKKIELLTPHSCHLSLGKTVDLYKECYRALFEHILPERTVEDTRNATNKA